MLIMARLVRLRSRDHSLFPLTRLSHFASFFLEMPRPRRSLALLRLFYSYIVIFLSYFELRAILKAFFLDFFFS